MHWAVRGKDPRHRQDGASRTEQLRAGSAGRGKGSGKCHMPGTPLLRAGLHPQLVEDVTP